MQNANIRLISHLMICYRYIISTGAISLANRPYDGGTVGNISDSIYIPILCLSEVVLEHRQKYIFVGIKILPKMCIKIERRPPLQKLWPFE